MCACASPHLTESVALSRSQGFGDLGETPRAIYCSHQLHLRFPGELHERLLRVVADGAEDLAVKHARREADARAAVDGYIV